jgi:hypothetical protein
MRGCKTFPERDMYATAQLERRGGKRTLQMMPFEDPGRRTAMGLSFMRHSGVMYKPGLLVLGSRRGGIPLAGAVRG